MNNNQDTEPTICICDENGVHYPCSICGKYYDDELDAVLCCMETFFQK